MAGFLRDEKGLSLLTLLIGYRALKYSSWNEKEIKAFLTPGCKWTTNPWAGLLFILQLCKPQISFFPLFPLNGVTVYIQINSWQTRLIISFNFQVQALIRARVNFSQGLKVINTLAAWWSTHDGFEYSSPVIDWLHIGLCEAALQIRLWNSSSAACLDVDYASNLISLKMVASAIHSKQSFWARNIFWTLESAYLHTVTELQLWSQKSLSLFHIYFVSLIT